MSKKELTLEEAENIVDNMYQKRWVECGVEDVNTIHMGNLDKLHYSELERASILLLRTEMRFKRENKKYKEAIDKAIEYINLIVLGEALNGEPVLFKEEAEGQYLLSILKEVKK